MVQTAMMTGGTTLTERLASTTEADAGDWDGTVTWRFEAVISTNNAARTATIRLREAGGSTNLISFSSTSTVPQRFSGTFTHPGGFKRFTIWLVNSATPGDTTAHAARIIVDQTGTITKRAFEIPMGSFDTETSTSYVALPDAQRVFWLAEKTKFDGTTTTALNLVAKLNNVDASGLNKVALAVKGTTTAVTGSEATVASTSILHSATGDFYGNLVDGNEYEIINKANTGNTVTLYRASIRIKQTGTPKKAQVVIQAGWNNDESVTDLASGVWNHTAPSSFDENTGQRTLIDLAKYSAATSIQAFHEGTLKNSDATGGTLQLFDGSTNDSGVTGGAVSGGDVVANSATMVRKRSGNIKSNIIDGNRFFARLNVPSGETTTVGNSWLLVDIDDSAAYTARKQVIVV